MLNDNYSIEPRVALKWKLDSKQTLTAGFGIHSKLEPVSIYLGQQIQADGSITTPNKNLEATKARHFVVGYENRITENMHFKTEVYYQSLYDVPVEDDENSSYSMLNAVEGFTTRTLVNKGTGTNYGVELTLERFFVNDYYFLATASIYESKYEALDGIERSTRFEGNFAGNLLAGKEFKISKHDESKTLTVSTKLSYIGGSRYTPINLEKSIQEHNEVRYDDKPYSIKGDDIFRTDFSVSYRKNKKRTTRELKLEIQNATNNQSVVAQYYNSRKEEIEDSNQWAMMPLLSYKIEF